jgi:hypothetical protein
MWMRDVDLRAQRTLSKFAPDRVKWEEETVQRVDVFRRMNNLEKWWVSKGLEFVGWHNLKNEQVRALRFDQIRSKVLTLESCWSSQDWLSAWAKARQRPSFSFPPPPPTLFCLTNPVLLSCLLQSMKTLAYLSNGPKARLYTQDRRVGCEI